MTDNAIEKVDLSYIREIRPGPCGYFGSYELYYRNTHPSRKIRVFYRETDNTHPGRVIPHQMVLNPSPDLDLNEKGPEDRFVGCPRPYPTAREFYWEMYDARYED